MGPRQLHVHTVHNDTITKDHTVTKLHKLDNQANVMCEYKKLHTEAPTLPRYCRTSLALLSAVFLASWRAPLASCPAPSTARLASWLLPLSASAPDLKAPSALFCGHSR
jgi:hypothetical protein